MQKQCRRAQTWKKSCREIEGCGKKVMERCKVTESNAKMVSRKKHKQKTKTQKTTHACEHNGKR